MRGQLQSDACRQAGSHMKRTDCIFFNEFTKFKLLPCIQRGSICATALVLRGDRSSRDLLDRWGKQPCGGGGEAAAMGGAAGGIVQRLTLDALIDRRV